jgi:hypothetical protein
MSNCGDPDRGGSPDTAIRLNLAAIGQQTHTFPMNPTKHPRLLLGLMIVASAIVWANATHADEIRLKDGKKLYGVIVGYEDNMFKVKTDFGYVLVEKDKIASIIPDSPGQSATAKTDSAPKSATSDDAKMAPAAEPVKKEKPAPVITNSDVRPEIPKVNKASTDTSAPTLKTTSASPKTSIAVVAPQPPPPKEVPASAREEVQGNLYINHEFAFRMYKAPSWQLIEGAGQALPNAIVAMGTPNESTLLVVGHEQSKGSLDAAAQGVEKRLHNVYDNYRLISQRKTVVGGQPAMEYRYRGMAEDHDWSGTLSVVSHGGEFLTVLGMTFADSDLIQIQENVIARAIASLDFNSK